MDTTETQDRGDESLTENEARNTVPARPIGRRLLALNILYAILIGVITLYNSLGPEHWWYAALNNYLPQAIWLAPGVVLLPATFILYRRLSWIPLAVLLWVVGPIMGFVWHWPQNLSRAPGTAVRVMTYNVKWGNENPNAIVGDIRKFSPDLIVMEDSAGVLQTPVGPALDGWNLQTSGQFTVASRVPISKLNSIDVSYAGSNHHAVRFSVLANGRQITCYLTHLLSPRDGLVNVRHHHLKPFLANVDDRVTMGRLLRDRYVSDQKSDPEPAIVMGDLNSPVNSLVCGRFFAAGLSDAFSDAGSGYGYTYGGHTVVGFPYMRIDHILLNSRLKALKCWAGNAQGSDHCPVIADLSFAN